MMKKKILLGMALALASRIVFAGAVNINTADAKTLAKELVGVGASKAEAIIKLGSSRVDLQACKLEYSIVSPK